MLGRRKMSWRQKKRKIRKKFHQFEFQEHLAATVWLGWHWHLATVHMATGILAAGHIPGRLLATGTWQQYAW